MHVVHLARLIVPSQSEAYLHVVDTISSHTRRFDSLDCEYCTESLGSGTWTVVNRRKLTCVPQFGSCDCFPARTVLHYWPQKRESSSPWVISKWKHVPCSSCCYYLLLEVHFDSSSYPECPKGLLDTENSVAPKVYPPLDCFLELHLQNFGNGSK